MKRIVSFSGGVGSWAAARRVVDEHGTKDVTLLIADTNYEADDWSDFVLACITDVGARAVFLNDGRNIWDVFRDERFLGNTRIDVCSKNLKRLPIRRWLEANCDPEDTILYLGFDWTEEHRHERAAPRWAPFKIESPLCHAPYTEKWALIKELESRGIPVPKLYTAGFSHNNCGGACVKAGQANWAKLLDFDPERYLDAEAHEEKLRGMLGDVAILRDRRGGDTKPLTLKDFRIRITGGDEFDRDDWGACSCMESFDQLELL